MYSSSNIYFMSSTNCNAVDMAKSNILSAKCNILVSWIRQIHIKTDQDVPDSDIQHSRFRFTHTCDNWGN